MALFGNSMLTCASVLVLLIVPSWLFWHSPIIPLCPTEISTAQANLMPLSSPIASTAVNNTLSPKPLIEPGDNIYTYGGWDHAPIILEEFKLMFFTSAKIGCTVWKMLFRRMMNASSWNRIDTRGNVMLPWNPHTNGLKYLYQYSLEDANAMLTDPTWTKAIFVREPKERFISAYLDKAVSNTYYVQTKCCPVSGDCALLAKESPSNFFALTQWCDDSHWQPQTRRLPEKFWKYIDFVGYMDKIATDAEQLLRKIGAWHPYGTTGWGKHGNATIFSTTAGREHATQARKKLQQYLTPTLETQLEEYYARDYSNPHLNFTRTRITKRVDERG